MGRRDIIITGLFSLLALGGTALVSGVAMTENIYAPYVLNFGWIAIAVAVFGLGYMFRTAPKAALNAAKDMVAEREFLPPEITPAVLRKKMKNRTSVQIDSLNKTYAGKWMRISGRVNDVSDVSAMKRKFMLHMIPDGEESERSVSITFVEPWLDQLSALNMKDWISVVARVKGLNSGAMLEDGEIINIGEPPEAEKPKPPAPRKRSPRKPSAT